MILSFCPRWLLATASVTLALHGSLAAQDDSTAIARRIAALATIAIDEYALGVTDGRVVSQDELAEARLFLTEARSLTDRLPDAVRGPAAVPLDTLLARTARLEPAHELRVDVDGLRRVLADGLGIALDPMPQAAPSLRLGARIYGRACAQCHGETGSGDGPTSVALDPPPSDLTDRAALSGTTPLEFFRKISVGVAGTGMPAFEASLSVQERWAVALYAAGLRHRAADRTAGERWVARECRGCDIVFSDFAYLAGVSDDSLAALLEARTGSPVPDAAVAYARTAPAAEALGGSRSLAVRRAVRQVDSMVLVVERLAAEQRLDVAQGKALEAYLAFEAVEADVAARSHQAARGVERTFAELRAAAATGRDVGPRAVAARRALAEAEQVAGAASGARVLFGQSLVIILREGLEAILIIGALTALLVKAGARERTRELGIGVGLALVASLLTAVAFATVIRVSAAGQEAIEGLTMLLASAVLFWVASWMVSKIEAEKWRAFVSAKMRDALGSRRAFALGGVAFLAVYREGVETVLFYGALLGTADGRAGVGAVMGGLVVGAVMLAALYVAMQRFGVRIPLKPFFAVTGALLTVMAVSFAGQGVAELQAAGWVPATPLSLPALPALGVFPTVQTVVAQLTVAAAFAAALIWIFWVRPRPAAVRAGRG
ncbi:MAG: FTR1 family protein [Gemmatimonadota bacterium]|nr:FTR1 family protein [Gemmatimonadota bacterium]